jgi:hypothetical protein
MDEIMNPLRQMHISMAEFAAYKASIFFNPGQCPVREIERLADAIDLSRPAKAEVQAERTKYAFALFQHLL